MNSSSMSNHSLFFRLSVSIIEEHKSTTASPVLKRTKVPEKECGIQCDVS